MAVSLSDSFTYKKLIRFVFPSIAMMIVTSIYSIVDGFFISNFAGKNAFAAVNIIMPVLMAIGSFGFMIGTGGSALVAYTLGEGKKDKANEIFSMLIKLIVIVSIVLMVLGITFMPQISKLLKASDLIINDSIIYGRILLIALPFFMLQNSFQSFLVTAERANFGFWVSVACGLLNMLLDFLLVGVFKGGVIGAALATTIAQIVGGIIPLIYFLRENKSLLRLVNAKLELSYITKACANGSSEMLTNISASLMGILYNIQLMKYAAEEGVAAYGVVMYVGLIFVAVFFGYSIGVTPIIGYNYGAENHKELKNVYNKSIWITAIVSIAMTISAEVFARPISKLFVGYDAELLKMTIKAMEVYSLAFLLCGFNIFASAFFTGLGNGKLSAFISVLRTLIIQVVAIVILPMIWHLNGIWWATVVAEGLTIMITITILIANKKVYKY